VADLKDFYPGMVQASPRGDGSPAAPASIASGGGAMATAGGSGIGDHAKTPALWVLVIVGLGFVLLHNT